MAQRGLAVAFALALFIEEIRTDWQHLRALQQAPILQPGTLQLNVSPPLRWTFSARLLVFRKRLGVQPLAGLQVSTSSVTARGFGHTKPGDQTNRVVLQAKEGDQKLINLG